MNIEDLSGCIRTYEQQLAILENLEIKIAEKWGIDSHISDINYDGTIRESIIFYQDVHEECELVRDYHAEFSSYFHYLKDDFSVKHLELDTFINLCNYCHTTGGLSYTNKSNTYYQKILNCGKNNVIPALIKYINFGWVVFSLLHDISNNDLSDFPKEHAGYLDKVKEYWLNWAKVKGY